MMEWIKKSIEGSYMDQPGKKRIGTYLKLEPDTYTTAFLYQLHRYYLEDECSDVDEAPKLHPEIFKE